MVDTLPIRSCEAFQLGHFLATYLEHRARQDKPAIIAEIEYTNLGSLRPAETSRNRQRHH
jgi:hypothetical protein